MKRKRKSRHQAPITRPKGGPVFVSPEDQKGVSLDSWSFVALSEGLQNALAACGGVPREVRTDWLSAACRNRDGSFSADITRRYHALCSHYGLAYSRNNRGVAHENGRVESPHGHLKERIKRAHFGDEFE